MKFIVLNSISSYDTMLAAGIKVIFILNDKNLHGPDLLSWANYDIELDGIQYGKITAKTRDLCVTL